MAIIGGRQPVQPYNELNQKLNMVSFQFWGSPIFKEQDGTLSCPGYTGNTYASNAWDIMSIGYGFTALEQNEQAATPGLISLDIQRGRSLDNKKGAGSDGERITMHGVKAARVQAQITIWTPQQLKMLELMWSRIQPPAGKGIPEAFDCSHPALKMHGIKSLQFYEAEGPIPGSIPKSRVFTIRAIEFLLPSRTSKTTSDEKAKATAQDPKPVPKPGTNPDNLGPT